MKLGDTAGATLGRVFGEGDFVEAAAGGSDRAGEERLRVAEEEL